AAIGIWRHAMSVRHRESGALDLPRAGAMLQLQHRFRDSIQSPGGASRLAGGEHPAPGVEGKSPLADVAAREARKIVARDHAEIVELGEHHGRIIVVDRGDIDIRRAHASGPPQLAGEGADAGLQAVALLIVVVEACAVRAHAHRRAAAWTTIGGATTMACAPATTGTQS